MKTYYLFILLFLVACQAKKVKKQPGPCKDSTYRAYVPDELKNCTFRPDAEVNVVMNIYRFTDQEAFEKFFVPFPDLDFSRYLVAGIILDNKIAVLEAGKPALKDISLSLAVDSAYIKDCTLHIPFTVTRLDSVPASLGHTYSYERKAFVVRIPKQSGFTKVIFSNSKGGDSQTYILD